MTLVIRSSRCDDSSA